VKVIDDFFSLTILVVQSRGIHRTKYPQVLLSSAKMTLDLNCAYYNNTQKTVVV